MLLQVHDELVFEAPEAEVEPTIKTVTARHGKCRRTCRRLLVPLKVDARAAHNWDEAH